MPRKPPKAIPSSLPADLIPDTALPPNLVLDAQGCALRDVLRVDLERAGFVPIECFAFCTRLLMAVCEDSTACGLALHPPHSPIRIEKGQRRRVRAAAHPVRERADEPIVILIARMLMNDGLAALQERDTARFAAERALATIAEALHELANDSRWKPLLMSNPDFHRHRLFELHYETYGYPAYPFFAADLHYGLIARLAQLQGAPEEKWEHALRTTITAPKALIPVIPGDWLPEHPEELDMQQARAILEQAAERLEGIEPSTRADYVGKFLDLLESGAARRPYRVRSSRLARRHLHHSGSEDFDEMIERESGWETQLAALEHGFDVDDNIDFSTDATTSARVLRELDGLSPSDKQRQARFIRQRIVLDRNRTVYSPGVIPLHELASYYAALSSMSDSANAIARWEHLTKLVFLDFLIHTGRPPEWIAAIQVGTAPQMPCLDSPPIYDPARGLIAYTPNTYPTIPAWLQPPAASASADDIAAWQFRVRQHDAAYEPISFVYELPLTPVQQALITELIRAREAALGEMEMSTATSSELFLVPEGNPLRAWNDSDTDRLLAGITAFVRHLHPAWRTVTSTRIARSFEPHYSGVYGLDPVYASYISGQVGDTWARPVHYSYVRVEQLYQAYCKAQSAFRQALEGEHALTARAGPAALPWIRLEPGHTEFHSKSAFGSWRYPRIEVLQRIFRTLEQMAADSDPQPAHNARIALYTVQLQASIGLRPFEVVALSRRAVDLTRKRITLTGKPNPAFETHRQIPIPDALHPSISALMDLTTARRDPEDADSLFWVWENGGRIPAQVHDIERVWREAAARAGLEQEQVPDLYALRHFFRSRALEMGLPIGAINALMGHQVAGCELYNPYLGNDPSAVFEQGRQLAAHILVELNGRE